MVESEQGRVPGTAEVVQAIDEDSALGQVNGFIRRLATSIPQQFGVIEPLRMEQGVVMSGQRMSEFVLDVVRAVLQAGIVHVADEMGVGFIPDSWIEQRSGSGVERAAEGTFKDHRHMGRSGRLESADPVAGDDVRGIAENGMVIFGHVGCGEIERNDGSGNTMRSDDGIDFEVCERDGGGGVGAEIDVDRPGCADQGESDAVGQNGHGVMAGVGDVRATKPKIERHATAGLDEIQDIGIEGKTGVGRVGESEEPDGSSESVGQIKASGVSWVLEDVDGGSSGAACGGEAQFDGEVDGVVGNAGRAVGFADRQQAREGRGSMNEPL